MLKEIKIIDEAKGIARVTTADERWYFKSVINPETGLPETQFVPSVTWIASCYPKSKGLTNWREDVGREEADLVKKAAGARGSKVHYACEDIDKGLEIDIRTAKYTNPNNNQPEELTADEILYVLNYKNFIDENKNVLLASEITVFGDVYAGTIDKIWAVAEPNGKRQIWLIDLKTSKSISREHELQLAAYSFAKIDHSALGITDKEWKQRKLGILRLDYGKDRVAHLDELKDGSDDHMLFRYSIYPIWKDMYGNNVPKQYEFPLKIAAKSRVVTGFVAINLEPKVGEKKIKKAITNGKK